MNAAKSFRDYGFLLRHGAYACIFYSFLMDLSTLLRLKNLHERFEIGFNKAAGIEILRVIRRKYAVKFASYYDAIKEVFLENQHWQYADFYPSGTVLDLGCGVGDYMLLALKYFNCDRVIGVDAFKEVCDVARENLKINSIKPNKFKILNYALSDKSGTSAMSIRGVMANLSDNGKTKVKSITIDELVRRLHLNKVDFIKMDLEGSEYLALNGAKKTLTKFKPKIVVEVHSSILKEKVLSMLASLGYSVIHEYSYGDYREHNQSMDNVSDIFALSK